MRHALGVLGVLAAGVLLAVSAAMNWRFGYQLGKTELDGFIYGSASAAADCMKALIPFFFFAALRNRMWAQAAAAAMVGAVVTAYSLTSALGHAALNRMDTTGHRAVEAQSYQDLRADLKRAQEQLAWVPQHRPAATVQGEMEVMKNRREWNFTKGCTEVTGRQGREFCQQFFGLTAELASAEQTAALEGRIAEVQSKLGRFDSGEVIAASDPQAAVLAKLAGILLPNVKVEDIQTGLTVFIALLLEVGSTFGMFIAFSQWRLYDRQAPSAPSMASLAEPPAPVAKPLTIGKPTANDNRTSVKLVAPDSDTERFFKERIETKDEASVSMRALYNAYLSWCEEKGKEPMALALFGRDIGELGIQKAKVNKITHYIGIALKSGAEIVEEDKKSTALKAEAA
jgi:hypothetical protein